jgi:hypothetical protein
MNKIIEKIYDHRQANSWAANLRNKRIDLFKTLISSMQHPIKILDVGGSMRFWTNSNIFNEEKGDVEITLLNIDSNWFNPDSLPATHTKIKTVVGDARNMKMFGDKEFDIVFSNSVIEHVGDYNDQRQMINEITRVGKKYFIQTPNLYFIIEPHFVFPFFQFLPLELKTWLVSHLSLGWCGKISDQKQAREIASSIRLLSKKDLLNLLPSGNIWEEKIFGLTKSFIIYGGWEINI